MVNSEGFLQEEVKSKLDFGRKAGHAGSRKNGFGKKTKMGGFKYSVTKQ